MSVRATHARMAGRVLIQGMDILVVASPDSRIQIARQVWLSKTTAWTG